MNKTVQRTFSGVRATKPLRLGYVPLTDCAPIIVAERLGLYRKHGLNVSLSREVGWATVRDKIVYGELDAAHAVAGMPFALALGLGPIPCECVTGMVLSLNGNAITLSMSLHERGVTDGASLRQLVVKEAGKRKYTFGVAFPFSTHHFLMRHWLKSFDIDPDQDVRIAVVPPPQMFANLKAGNLDGYCVGEPWNTQAVKTGVGWCVAVSADLAPRHPEKLLLVRKVFAMERREEHLSLIAALIEACAYCDEPANRKSVAAMLVEPGVLSVSEDCVWPSLSESFDCGVGRIRRGNDFHVFHESDANEPGADKEAWVINQLILSGAAAGAVPVDRQSLRGIFRPDIFTEARARFERMRAGRLEERTNPEPMLSASL